MKKVAFIIFMFMAAFALTITSAFAAPRQNQPVTITQPTGEKIQVFASGDEFYHRLHDKDGYTIVQNPKDGWFYYAKLRGGNLVPTKYKVGAKNPQKTSLKPNAAPSAKKLKELHDLYRTPAETKFLNGGTMQKSPASNAAKASFSEMNNVVILIRFSDDSEFPIESLQTYDTVCNGMIHSLKHYYNEVSYGDLTVHSYFYPWYAGVTQRSYQDNQPRGYYRPYNASTNTIGYKSDYEQYIRRQTLLTNAVQWVNSNTPIPGSMNIDGDGNGYVDNVSFILRGDSDNWMDLLWAHRSSLSTGAKLQNKTVSTYIFMPENQADRRTFCHEFFHALGAPDLYHYYEGLELSPGGEWVIMESSLAHMSSYMKNRYANWVDIDTIKKSGVYSVKPLVDNRKNVAKVAVIPTGTIKQLLLMEYRKTSGLYESNLPGSGLLVYRINPAYSTNADYNGSSQLDMLYLFRPNGTPTANGIIANAYFSQKAGRTFVNDYSEPTYLFKSRGEATEMGIYNVNVAEDSATFYFHFGDNFEPSNISSFYNLTTEKIDISWTKNPSGTGTSILVVSENNNFKYLDPDVTYNVGTVLPEDATVIYKGTAEQFNYTPAERGKTLYFTVFSVQNSGYSLGVTSQAYSPTLTVECSVFANIDTVSTSVVVQEDTTAEWGYFAGHSGANNTMFAEYFNNNKILLIKGLTVNVAKNISTDENSTVEFWIAEANDDVDPTSQNVIERVLYREPVAIQTLSKGVNEIVFDVPVMIRKNFLAGFTVTYNGDTFALKVAPATGYTHAGKSTLQFYTAPNYSMAIFPNACNGIEGQTGFFVLSPDTIGLAAAKNSAALVNVWIDGRDWNVSNVPDWLSVIPNKIDGILNVSAKTSNQYGTRSTRITLSASNGETRTLAVGQKGFGNTPPPEANENISAKSNVRLYPNPSKGGIFSLDVPLSTSITVFDINGKTLIRGIAQKGVSQIDL
ncbi:MAG: hypothetical protein LBC49_04990, partial [Bacteroidales bacterium]|nr:hypothetical protein [Bacteroidales bacterium]